MEKHLDMFLLRSFVVFVDLFLLVWVVLVVICLFAISGYPGKASGSVVYVFQFVFRKSFGQCVVPCFSNFIGQIFSQVFDQMFGKGFD